MSPRRRRYRSRSTPAKVVTVEKEMTVSDYEQELSKAESGLQSAEAQLAVTRERDDLLQSVSQHCGVVDISTTFANAEWEYGKVWSELVEHSRERNKLSEQYFSALLGRVSEVEGSYRLRDHFFGRLSEDLHAFYRLCSVHNVWSRLILRDKKEEVPLLFPAGLSQPFEFQDSERWLRSESWHPDALIIPHGRISNPLEVVGNDFRNKWQEKYDAMATRHAAEADALTRREAFWDLLTTVFESLKTPGLQNAFRIKNVNVGQFEVNMTEWIENIRRETYQPDLFHKKTRIGYEVIPFPSLETLKTGLASSTLKGHIRTYRKTIQRCKNKLAILTEQIKAEDLQSELEAEKKKRKASGLERAAAVAHYGDIRKIAPEVRKELERIVSADSPCPYCGGLLGNEWQADHIYPVKLGGLSTLENMVAVCFNCNNKKSDKTLSQFLRDEDRDRDAVERHLAELGKNF